MDKKKEIEKIQREGEDMPAVAKKEELCRGLALSSKKLTEISVKPKIKNGKVLLDKKNKDHRYILDEE
ncbi:MAG: hypothetical protein WC109_02470 [Syntrophomonadaceae bacterium]|nr:hypothetical protein [Syntrophomonadaceae bacterium]MDD4562544.1 hypothetical protein [Syntrophomonadaceae bacterium]